MDGGGEPAREAAIVEGRNGSRRHVTVMFCDLVGSTSLSELLDPEVLRDVLLQFQDVCAGAVGRFDGYVARYVGDGVLVYFGYPRAHEDDARRATCAGLAIVEAVGKATFDTGDGGPVSLQVRVGIHTGVAVIAEMGSGERRELHDIVGDTPNIASRVHSAARPQSVVVSRATYDLVRGYFDVVELGPQPLRGLAGAVELFEVLDNSGAETRLEAVPERTPMIDREQEAATLLAAWSDALAGKASSFVIEGEAGIGKSRLVELVRDEVVRQGGATVTISCSPLHTNTVLNPVVRMLSRVAGLDEDGCSSPWARLVERLSAFGPVSDDDAALVADLLSIEVPAFVPRRELTAEHRREQTFQAFVRIVDRMASASPHLLVAEDVHWADPSTLELLGRLASRAGTSRTLLLLTTRPGGPPLPGASPSRLCLEPLDADHTDQMVRELLHEDIDDSVRRLIVERSDGIPLFVEELSRTLKTSAGDGPAVLTTGAVDIPPSLHDLLAARLDTLPRRKTLAQAVATIGHPASPPLVGGVLGLDPGSARAGLDELVRADILVVWEQAGIRSYSFSHALLRDAAYNSQLRPQRRLLHARIADVMEGEWPQVAQRQPEVLAHHLACAGQGLRSAEYWNAAGLVAAEMAAHTEAVGHFGNALAVLDGVSDHRAPALRHAVQGALACSLLALRGYTSREVEEAYRLALALGREAGAGRPETTITWGLWAYYTVRGEHGVALDLALRASEAAGSETSSSDSLVVAAILGYQRFYLGDFVAARPLLELAASYHAGANPGYPNDPGVAALANLGPTLLILGELREADETMAEAVARADELSGPSGLFTKAYVHAFAAWYFELACEPKRAKEHATRAVEISVEHGFATWLGAGGLHLAIAEANIGEAERAIPSIEWGITAWAEAGAELFRPYYLFWLADARRQVSDHDGALAAVEEALAVATGHDERFFEAELRRLHGELTGDLGRLWEAVEVARRQQAKTFELRAATSLHRLAVERRRAQETEGVLRAVLEWFPGDVDAPDLRRARAALDGRSG